MDIHDKPIPELAFMGFQRWLPHPELRPFIECYWLVDAFLESERTENFYPDGGCGLIFNFADALESDKQVLTRDVVQEMRTTVCPTVFRGRLLTLGVHFHPGGTGAFFDIPAREWPLSSISVDTLDATFGNLYDDLGNLKNHGARLSYLDRVFRKKLRERTDLSLVKGFRSLITRYPDQRIGTIADKLGVSHRQLERVFLDQVGLTPMKILQLTRVSTARDLLKKMDTHSLSFIGQELGYYDQGHFIREFKRVMGMTPGKYRKRSQHRRRALL